MNNILPWHLSNMETLESRIIRHEGFCSFPKYDAKGFYCVGFGHDITKDECDNYSAGITWEEAEELLYDDLKIIKKNSAKEFTWISNLNDIRQEVIWEMCYQLGVGGVAQFKDMISAIKDNDWDSAAQEMLDSQWHIETPIRCEELANLMISGENS